MDVGYVDTSCLVAVAFAEPRGEAIAEQLTSYERLIASNLVEAELSAVMAREGVPPDARLIDRIAWVLPDRPLSSEIGFVLTAGYLRGADLWHLACALFVSPDPSELSFLTVDRTQAAVAAGVGFVVPKF